MLGTTLNLEYGFSGQLNFGKVLFYGLGAFSAGVIVSYLLPYLYGITEKIDACSAQAVEFRVQVGSSDPSLSIVIFLICIGVGAAVAAGFGFLLSLPALRINEGFVLGIVLLVAGEAVRIITGNYNPIVCGYQGLSGLPGPFSSLANTFLANSGMSFLIMISASIVFIYVYKLSNSPYGRMLKSMRDDPIASETYGKFVNKSRIRVLVLGSAISGIAGVLYVFYVGYISSTDFIPDLTFQIWVMMILGGTGNNRGILLGTFVLTCINEGTALLTTQLQFNQFYVGISSQLNYLRFIIEGVILIVILLYRPGGIFPEKPIKTSALKSTSNEKTKQ